MVLSGDLQSMCDKVVRETQLLLSGLGCVVLF